VATTASAIPSLDALARQSIHRLGVLLGEPPMALAEALAPPQQIPKPPPDVPVGLPSDLLRRRPDVRRAERRLAASTARIGAATADLFPRFSLTGSLGTQAGEAKGLFNYANRFYSIGPRVSWPIFDAGRIRANIRVQNAREEQALAAYEQTVLLALRDVEDALVGYLREEDRRRTLATAAEANRRAVELANQLYNAGRTDFLNVLQAQRDLFASQDALVQSDRLVSTNLVALYKALGGGLGAGRPAGGGDARGTGDAAGGSPADADRGAVNPRHLGGCRSGYDGPVGAERGIARGTSPG
jgi:NodT family efflux transporter outer membrane factor (OMF) lipoprotein